MSDIDRFLGAIGDAPDDDAPRLVFADWLEEQGDPDRAALIRTQVELARLPEDDPARLGLLLRESMLLAENGQRWGSHLPWATVHYRRGFAHTLECRLDDWIDHADTVRATSPPLRGAWFRGLERREIVRLALLDRFPPLEELSLSGNRVSRAEILALLASPLLRGVRALDLADFGTDDGLAAAILLASSSVKLRQLRLSSNRLAAFSLDCLLRPNFSASLRLLDLSATDFGWEAANRVRASESFDNLVELVLDDNPIDDQAACELAGSTYWPRLQRISLRGTPMTDRGRIRLRERFGRRVRF